MGLTTLTALVLRGHAYTVAHVGDTRCYLVRDGKATLLTQDHVVNHPDFKHQLLHSAGAEDHLMVDYLQGDLQVGDVSMLLSDGVHGEVPERRLPEYAAMPDAREASQKLVDQALAKGSEDNVSAMVVRVQGLLEATSGRRQPPSPKPAHSTAPEGGRHAGWIYRDGDGGRQRH